MVRSGLQPFDYHYFRQLRTLCQTFALLLAALWPILKHILASCRLTSPFAICIVTLHLDPKCIGSFPVSFASEPSCSPPSPLSMIRHAALDLTCLVAAWLLCATAPAALHLGKTVETFAAMFFLKVEQVLPRISVWSDARREIAREASKLLEREGMTLLNTIGQGIAAVLAWKVDFFVKLAVGSLLFLMVSALLARALCRSKGLVECIYSGVCGPLWLVGDESTEGAVFAGVGGVMVLRSLLLFALVARTWFWMDPFSAEAYFALVFNRLVDLETLKKLWTAVMALHCLLGLAALYSAKAALELVHQPPSQQPALNLPTQSVYGSFPVRSVGHGMP